jgi:hypothetical protein
MAFTADETTAYTALSTDLSGTRAKCNRTAIKWGRALIVRGGVAVYETGSEYSGSDDQWYPKWVKNYVTNSKSTKDSEIKLLVDLEYYGNLQANDLIVMLGDDGPCPSCKAVIRKFANYYRNNGAAGLLVTVIYTVAAYTLKNGIWPAGGLYGHGNPITDEPPKYYYRP